VTSPGSQGMARIAVAGLGLLLMLLAQAGGMFDAAPRQATLAVQIEAATAQADRSRQPMSCAEHGDATCCMAGQCESIAGSPVDLPATDRDLVASLTRYAGAVEAHDAGYAARPTLPPPRRSV
jgi:hypothetical protein